MSRTQAAQSAAPSGDVADVLTDDAVAFLTDLHRRFAGRRADLLAARRRRRAEIARTGRLDLRPDTAAVRAGDWTVPPPPADLTDRRVEITGPTDRKMTINALNSGARVWLADLEDANTPHWANVIGGQRNLADAVRRTITLRTGAKTYRLGPGPYPTIVVRPRGWHLDERHLDIDGGPAVGALVDAGLYLFHNAAELLRRDSGPYLYLPKLESHEEAALWHDVFAHTEATLGLPTGCIRATVLIETITAAFEMDEILWALGPYATGLNAGRWDYLFSIIKNFRDAGEKFVLPDRSAVTMTAPFMRAYTELLVATCHRRGAMAIGGMSAFIPNRRDTEATARAVDQVRADKLREAGDGFDGSWVAHPDLVPVCREVFDEVLGDRPHQLDRQRPDVTVTADQLLDVAATGGAVTAAGLRGNVAVALRYLEAWLRGNGAVAINNLMEDAATAEISRSQIWQWIHNGVRLPDGTPVTADLVRAVGETELAAIRAETTSEDWTARRFPDAWALFVEVALADDFVDFLTLPAYRLID
ncbi:MULTISPECIES: malate synthase A [unclassified Solwaraspora]|uniref:malate synthase A n=1 Tax=unclassified Solwaraspora TaxID=2627926 RepID=UPI00259BAC55|nr:malate synthase A [Solwaraspora sp. WMMA2056]WJK38770.1 malate synthase A [Solwaraspora sp. WMMA2056]